MSTYCIEKHNAMKRFVLLLVYVLAVCSAFPHSVKEKDGVFTITHSWEYKDDYWKCHFDIDKSVYEYYQQKPAHQISQVDELATFVISENDRVCLRELIRKILLIGEKAGYSDDENVYNVVAFVQSLKYVTDEKSKGCEEYYRYPVETLVDGEGDCEDSSILIAAILQEMGYGVVFLAYEGHLALGLRAVGAIPGSYYTFRGGNYYYLETTNSGWHMGEMPSQYMNETPLIIPLIHKPIIHFNTASYQYDGYYDSDREVQLNLNCEIENVGLGATQGLYLHVLVKSAATSGNVIREQYFKINDLDGEMKMQARASLFVPRPLIGVIECRIEGYNVEPQSITIEDLNLK